MNRFKTLGLLAVLALVALVGLSPMAQAMDTSYHAPVGPSQLYTYSGSDLGIASGTTLVGSTTKTGSLVVSNGIKSLAVSFVASHAYTATLTTYLDEFGSVTEQVATAAAAANVPLVLRTTAGDPFASFEVKITDTSGTTGTCQVRDALGQN